MNTVEATCRGDPGAVFLSSTVRSAIYATQVSLHFTLDLYALIYSLNTFNICIS